MGLFKAFGGLSQPVFLAERLQRTQEKAALHEPFPAHDSDLILAAPRAPAYPDTGDEGLLPQGHPR